MSLDDGYVPWQEFARRAEAEDRARAQADYEEQRLLESVEAEEAKWERIFRQSAEEREPVHYKTVGQGYDTRLFGGYAS